MFSERDALKALLEGRLWDMQAFSEERTEELISIFLAALDDRSVRSLLRQPTDTLTLYLSMFLTGRASAFDQSRKIIMESKFEINKSGSQER